MSFADDRRLIQLAASLKSLEAVAKHLGKDPKAVAKAAKRLGVSLTTRSRRAEESRCRRGLATFRIRSSEVPRNG
jgi:hypothetical protein